MATLKIGPDVRGGFANVFGAVDLTAPGLSVTRANETLVRIEGPGGSFVISGTGLQTDLSQGVPIGLAGTVTEIRVLDAGDDLIVRLTDPGWAWSAVTDAVMAEALGTDETAFDQLLLGLTYSYDGNNKADVLAPGAMTDSGLPLTFAGDDSFLFRGGNDNFALGAGNDTASGGAGRDTIHGEDGDDRITGGGQGDMLTGGAGNDSLNGGGGGDQLFGGADDDSLIGGGGADVLDGGAGNDELNGGGAKDRLSGGSGDNTLTGGGDRDLFDFVSIDSGGLTGGANTITDFQLGRDTIEVLDIANWSVISAAEETLVIGRIDGATITLEGILTGSNSVANLLVEA